MVDSDVMKGLPFNQKRGNDVIHLFQLRWGEGKTGSGFAPDQFILFLSIGSLIEMFIQRAFIAGRTAVAYIGRPGKSGADILFVEDTGRSTFAAGPAEPAFAKGTFPTYHLSRALMQKGETAVVECPAISPAFFKADVVFHFFGDGGTILI